MSKDTVVVLIFTHKPELTAFEAISLVQCWRVLGNHPLRLVCPRGMDAGRHLELAPGLQVDYIQPAHLASYERYERLKVTPSLYERFRNYEFILIYELDSFVFRDELLDWCNAAWDYIGAPWFEGFDRAAADARYVGGGNGGFSLRRVKSARAVLHSWKMISPAREVWRTWREHHNTFRMDLWWLLGRFIWRNNFYGPLNDYWGSEDLFWCLKVAKRFDWFRVAPIEEARKFSFEVNPRRLLKETGRLPFGCHKWHKYDLPFWKPIIESFGFELP